MASPRVFDGRIWNSVPEANDSGVTPIKPVLEGDGKIFVQIASYRGKLFNGRYVLVMSWAIVGPMATWAA